MLDKTPQLKKWQPQLICSKMGGRLNQEGFKYVSCLINCARLQIFNTEIHWLEQNAILLKTRLSLSQRKQGDEVTLPLWRSKCISIKQLVACQKVHIFLCFCNWKYDILFFLIVQFCLMMLYSSFLKVWKRTEENNFLLFL